METLQNLIDLIPDEPWLRAGIIALASVLAASLAGWVCTRTLRVLVQRTSTDADDEILTILRRPTQITVVILGLLVAVQQLKLDAVHPETSELLTGREEAVESILLTIGILVWTVAALRLCTLVLRVLSKDTRHFQVIEPTTLPLFENLGKVVVVAFAVYLLIEAWNKDISAFLASAGIMGIAVGFAAKDTLSNLFAGVFILADAPYRKGDFIVIDSGERGRVMHIGLRSTRLLTRDDIEITIPNAVMGGAKILNETAGASPKRRVRIKVGVAYGSDIDQVRRILLKVASDEEMVCGEPEARVRFRRFGDSALDFELLCWIPEPVMRGRAVDSLLGAVYKSFLREGIEIPFSKLDVNLRRS
jgi:MscS family membrane protein